MKQFPSAKGVRTNVRTLLRCRQSRHLSRNQDFDLLRQRNKQTSSISLKALKLAVFLAGSEFRLRIPFGKRICFPSPSAALKLLCLQSEAPNPSDSGLPCLSVILLLCCQASWDVQIDTPAYHNYTPSSANHSAPSSRPFPPAPQLLSSHSLPAG